jgi:uncharacterized damage-inducible protein DinB
MIALMLEQFRQFAYYNRRFNTRIYESAAKLTDEARKRDSGAFFGSIHGTLNHLLLADRLWLGRFRTAKLCSKALDGAELLQNVDSLKSELFSDFAALHQARSATDSVIEHWVASLTPAMLDNTIRYSSMQGVSREHAAWIAITHLFNHQTHHRGQVTTLLHQAGLDPGVTDFIAFVLNPSL